MCGRIGGVRVATPAIIIALSIFARSASADVVCSYEGQFDLRIPADPGKSQGWMNDAVIDVPSHLTIKDLDVSVDLTHSKIFDLQLWLVSPAGAEILLNMYDFRSGYREGADYHGTTFDDEAATPIEAGVAPFEGRYRPLNGYSLASFNGEDAYGPWRFRVYDTYYGDTGRFHSYSLAITVPEPATAAFLLLGLPAIARLQRRHRRRRTSDCA
jgi:subtilisin-like proprotein convertase family protein